MTLFSGRQWLSVLGPAFAAALTLIPSLAAAQQAASRPNILLIMADDLNNDFSTFGHPLVKTPNLDRLAARGVRFDRAYNQFPLCNPSRLSMLTGLRPDAIRIYDLVTTVRMTKPEAVTLPQLFRKNGYLSARVGKIFHYGNPGDIGTSALDDPFSWDIAINPRGIDKDEETKLTNLLPGRGLGSTLAYYASPAPDDQHTDGLVAAETIGLLEKLKDRPFFIGAGFYRPHCPFIAPKKYFDLYPLEKIPLPSPTDRGGVPAAAFFTNPPHWNVGEQGQRASIQAYYASISFLDANVGRVLDALDRLGLTDKTIVIFMSDHGYHLGDMGQWMKQTLFERSARTPLVIAAPGVGARGRASTRTIELVDLYPTLTDLTGVTPPAGLHGQSLRPLLQNPEAPWTRPAITQVRRGAVGDLFMGYSIRTDKWRYTEWDNGTRGVELYDEVADPAELKNLAADRAHQNTIAELQRLLRASIRP